MLQANEGFCRRGPMLHIDIPTLEEFKALAQIKGETCVSLYLPTSPLGSNAQLNRTAFKDLARDALAQLRVGGVDKSKIVAFERQFDHLAGAVLPPQWFRCVLR